MTNEKTPIEIMKEQLTLSTYRTDYRGCSVNMVEMMGQMREYGSLYQWFVNKDNDPTILYPPPVDSVAEKFTEHLDLEEITRLLKEQKAFKTYNYITNTLLEYYINEVFDYEEILAVPNVPWLVRITRGAVNIGDHELFNWCLENPHATEEEVTQKKIELGLEEPIEYKPVPSPTNNTQSNQAGKTTITSIISNLFKK